MRNRMTGQFDRFGRPMLYGALPAEMFGVTYSETSDHDDCYDESTDMIPCIEPNTAK